MYLVGVLPWLKKCCVYVIRFREGREGVGDGVWTTKALIAIPGDALVCDLISTLSHISVPAVLNPLTFSGTILVDGVAASVHALYIDAQQIIGSSNVRYIPALWNCVTQPALASHRASPRSSALQNVGVDILSAHIYADHDNGRWDHNTLSLLPLQTLFFR